MFPGGARIGTEHGQARIRNKSVLGRLRRPHGVRPQPHSLSPFRQGSSESGGQCGRPASPVPRSALWRVIGLRRGCDSIDLCPCLISRLSRGSDGGLFRTMSATQAGFVRARFMSWISSSVASESRVFDGSEPRDEGSKGVPKVRSIGFSASVRCAEAHGTQRANPKTNTEVSAFLAILINL